MTPFPVSGKARVRWVPRVVLLLGVVALGGEARTAHAVGRPDRFLIGAWGIGKVGDPARLVYLDDAGIDYVHNWDQWGPHATRRMVAQIESLRVSRPGFGLGALIHVLNLSTDPARIGEASTAQADAAVRSRELDPATGINGPGVVGWFITDEPCEREQFRRLGRLMRVLATDARSRDQLVLMNLLPMQEPGVSNCLDAYGPDRVTRYRAYLASYLSQFDSLDAPAPVLSMDMYPFQSEARPGRAYFECLSVLRDEAARYSRPGSRIPVWVIVQASPFREAGGQEHRTPTVAQIRWQAWCAIAYGAKGIAYWTAVPYQDSKTRQGWGDGLLDASGRPSARYDAIRSLNAELHVLGPTLLDLDAVTTLHVAPGRHVGLENARLGDPRSVYNIVAKAEAPSGREDCLIGYLKHSRTGDDYLLVVNRSVDRERSFDITLTNPISGIERVDTGTGALVPVAIDGRSFRVAALKPGTGALYRVRDSIEEYIPGVVAIDDTGDEVTFSTTDLRVTVDYRTGHRIVELGTGAAQARETAPTSQAAQPPRFRATPLGVQKIR